MSTSIGKTPFLRLLLPVITGIVVATYFPWEAARSFHVGLAGLLTMLVSYFVGEKQRYNTRWLFGAGLFLFLFAFAALRYAEEEKKTAPDFPAAPCYFTGTLVDIPETKPRSLACHVKTFYPVKKRVILYLQQTDEARSLVPGDELLFRAALQPFKNFGNPDDFDYARFMKIKGMAGSAYVPETEWCKTGKQHITLSTLSQRCRGKVLDFYRGFRLEPDAHAFLAAITLGYKAYLSDDLQAAFRASGTAHVLAVSGLHVGVIYMVINFLFSFLGKHGRGYAARQFLVITTLWAYALVAGMSAPVIRAAFMLTIYCVGRAFRRSGFTYNTLAAAAFFLLLCRPFSLHDVSFMMSFTAVFAILFFQPKIKRLHMPHGKISRYIWELSTISLSAQLGLFPLVLYYFGSFPTYFFIANLFVVPLLSLVIYTSVPLIIVSLFAVPDWLGSTFRWAPETLIEVILRAVHITETLPFAQLTDKHLTFFQLFLLLAFVYPIARFLVSPRARSLLTALAAMLLFLVSTIREQWVASPPPKLVVFNAPAKSEIGFFANKRRHHAELPSNGLVPHPRKSIVRLRDGEWEQLHAEAPFPLDVLILSGQGSFDLEKLLRLFTPRMVVLDSSIPRYAAARLRKEGSARGLIVHDVSLQGAYSVIF